MARVSYFFPTFFLWDCFESAKKQILIVLCSIYLQKVASRRGKEEGENKISFKNGDDEVSRSSSEKEREKRSLIATNSTKSEGYCWMGPMERRRSDERHRRRLEKQRHNYSHTLRPSTSLIGSRRVEACSLQTSQVPFCKLSHAKVWRPVARRNWQNEKWYIKNKKGEMSQSRGWNKATAPPVGPRILLQLRVNKRRRRRLGAPKDPMLGWGRGGGGTWNTLS